jgi:predicted Holliday junction resolvase-like endonuclease
VSFAGLLRRCVIPNPNLFWVGVFWMAGLGVCLAGITLVWILGERSARRLRAEAERRHQDLQARLERSQQERGQRLERSVERAERSLALQEEAVELARQAARDGQVIIALLQRLVEGKGSHDERSV